MIPTTGDLPQPLAITMGEPAGIGPEITLQAWHRRSPDAATAVVIGNSDHYRRLAERLELSVDVVDVTTPADAFNLAPNKLPVLPLDLPAPVEPGTLNPANAQAVIDAITEAVRLAMAGQVSAIVTNPIHKANLYTAGFTYPGHTEYIAALAGSDAEPIMMLAGNGLRVVPVTRHVSLLAAIQLLDADIICETVTTTVQALRYDLGIDKPRVAVTGLNPHAGEGGHLGREEIDIIAPAIARLRADGIDVTGPYAADTLFHDGARATYDIAICMYHDQALIPVKTVDFSGAVNVTLGLPFIRTSPDHGTALGIAGSGTADTSSLIAAMDLASTMSRHRHTVSALA